MTQQAAFILSVHDIGKARMFYRDIVGLGEPVLDSNFWVEFTLTEDASFCLEQNENTEIGSGRIKCLFRVPDLQAFCQRYAAAGFDATMRPPHAVFGKVAFEFADYEGNIVYITDRGNE